MAFVSTADEVLDHAVVGGISDILSHQMAWLCNSDSVSKK